MDNLFNGLYYIITNLLESIKPRLINVEERIIINDNLVQVYFTNNQGYSFEQILNNLNPNDMIEHLVAGREYFYNGWTDISTGTTYNGGMINQRSDCNGKYPLQLPLPPGTNAILFTYQYTNNVNQSIYFDVRFLIKNESNKWSYFLLTKNVRKQEYYKIT